MTSAPAPLAQGVDRLIRLVAHWQTGRWSTGGSIQGPGTQGPGTRADAVHALVQRLADEAADAEGAPRRTVPRLADTVLPDQLRVLADDLLTAGAAEDVLTRAAADVDALGRTL